MGEWQPIETLPRDEFGTAAFPVVVAWQINFAGWGWEYSTDEHTSCATHWMRLTEPSAKAIEARRAETLGSVHESAGRKALPND